MLCCELVDTDRYEELMEVLEDLKRKWKKDWAASAKSRYWIGSTKRQSCKRYILTISKCTFPVPRHKNEIKSRDH